MRKEIVLISKNKMLGLCLGMYLSFPEQHNNTTRINLFSNIDELNAKLDSFSISPDLIIFVCTYSSSEQISRIKKTSVLELSTPLILLSSFNNSEMTTLINNFSQCHFVFKTQGYTELLKEKTDSLLQFQEFKNRNSA